MNKGAWKLTVPLFVLSLGGAYISLLLLDKHLLKSHGPNWFAAVCGDDTAETARGGANCATVLASRWATIPPRPQNEDEVLAESGAQTEPFRVPSAYLGFVYFTSLAIWLLFVGQPTPDRREWYRLALAFVICGALGSLFFIFIMLTQLEEWCPWCLASHGLNFLILIGMLGLRPKREAALAATAVAALDPIPIEAVTVGEPVAQTAGDSTGEFLLQGAPALAPPPTAVGPATRSHPSLRLAVACILLAAATCAMVWNGYAVELGQQQQKLVQRQLDEFRGDRGFLATLYEQAPKVKIPLRPDDPQIAKDDICCPLVMFSDFECPWCRTFTMLLEKRIQGYFGGRLRVTWKHFPLSTDCNTTIQRDTHPEACQAARAAEAARLQGGNEAFWKAHDRLFASQKKLKDFDCRALAAELGLDPERFEADMKSPAVAARIAEDIALGQSLGVHATPTLFLSDRLVEGKLVPLMPFWEEMGQRFLVLREQKIREREARQHRAQESQPAATQPTPDIPDPIVVP